jgi:hypothetical protein
VAGLCLSRDLMNRPYADIDSDHLGRESMAVGGGAYSNDAPVCFGFVREGPELGAAGT